ncbi:hypothetical protein [Streptomyces sp. UNOC14_S4]|uniref:hypothetical protein n=1 Tax=Streptomyces sp. UNOC14_S4 TaxID=2872340 RepID=UPI001E623ECC|nr:hypothetical protein [Streptomyces sp. UNOC14_S4]MCC3770749.1 hypothetical protein [Streptomyces sp. UNOC14_S4]
MSPVIAVDPGRLQQFGDPQGAVFCLVTNPGLTKEIEITGGEGYAACLTVPMDEGESFEDVLRERVPEPAHVLAISPGAFFASPRSEDLGPRRKLMAMACNSTPTTLETVRHFLGVMERTSAAEQGAFSDTFFDRLEAADHLVYRDDRRGTVAVLDHLADGLEWNQQAGPLDWGEQQIVPSGEISVLPVEITEFHEDLRLPLQGEIVLSGHPILHNGTPSYTRRDQARVHARLAAMTGSAVVARVEDGAITGLRADTPGALPAVEMLEAMFAVDSRYRIVWEIGHALNTSLDLLPGNHAMNEVYGGTEGCLHWGLGLTPYTQYHLDIIAPGTTVYTDTGTRVLGVDGGYTEDRVATAVPGPRP